MCSIYDRAVQCGFDPKAEHPASRDHHPADAPKSAGTRKNMARKSAEMAWRPQFPSFVNIGNQNAEDRPSQQAGAGAVSTAMPQSS